MQRYKMQCLIQATPCIYRLISKKIFNQYSDAIQGAGIDIHHGSNTGALLTEDSFKVSQ